MDLGSPDFEDFQTVLETLMASRIREAVNGDGAGDRPRTKRGRPQLVHGALAVSYVAMLSTGNLLLWGFLGIKRR
jgi:hypothetical protein